LSFHFPINDEVERFRFKGYRSSSKADMHSGGHNSFLFTFITRRMKIFYGTKEEKYEYNIGFPTHGCTC
jgi:hypothetical protein